jgi:hypothetical protein
MVQVSSARTFFGIALYSFVLVCRIIIFYESLYANVRAILTSQKWLEAQDLASEIGRYNLRAGG